MNPSFPTAFPFHSSLSCYSPLLTLCHFIPAPLSSESCNTFCNAFLHNVEAGTCWGRLKKGPAGILIIYCFIWSRPAVPAEGLKCVSHHDSSFFSVFVLAQDGGVLAGPAEHQPVSHSDGASTSASQSHQQSSKWEYILSLVVFVYA